MATTAPLLTATVLAGDEFTSESVNGLPKAGAKLLESPMAWEGSNFADERNFVFHLSGEDISEIETALVQFKGTSLGPGPGLGAGPKTTLKLGRISQETFPLPTLGSRLRRLSRRLHQEEGFFVLRGLQPFRYTRLENTILYVGLSSYIGNKRGVQCAGGPVMTHIFDYSTEIEEKEKINDGYLGHANRTSYLPFHTDDGDIISLYCLQSADIGGRTLIASSWAIYNRLMAERPDVIETLKEEWTWDSFLKENPSFKRKLLIEHEGKLICNYRIRPFLGTPGYPRNTDLGPLPRHQEEALDIVGKIADELALKFNFQTGDIQYSNNLSMLHAREEFTRAPDENTRRHLLRIVLRDDEYGWSMPNALKHVMDSMFEHEPDEEKFPWSPEPLPYVIGQ